MKILLVHNFYGNSAPSGENQVFELERHLLLSRGHEVVEFTRYSDEILGQGAWGAVKGALATPWNPWMARAIQSELARFRPDVVHVHNTFPLLSPGIFHAIGERATRVLTLHNYRLFCPAAIPMRAGKVCTDCLEAGSSLPSMQHGCYRGSRISTTPLAFSVGLHRALGTWRNQVDAFIALSDFQRQLMSKTGLPESKVYVKPNFYPGMPSIVPWSDRSDYIVFVGRLSAEKGVTTLMKSWRMWGSHAPELRVVGDGELRNELEALAAGLPVRFLGQLSSTEAQEQISKAKLLVLPSEWFETFGLVIGEAFAFGTPAAVSNLGPLPSIVKHGESGVVFQAASPESLLHEVRQAWNNLDLLEQLGQGARREFETKYNEDANYESLMNIYEQAQAVNKGRTT
jgi:glycosyltransferase involved in cell wall biosynthesis